MRLKKANLLKAFGKIPASSKRKLIRHSGNHLLIIICGAAISVGTVIGAMAFITDDYSILKWYQRSQVVEKNVKAALEFDINVSMNGAGGSGTNGNTNGNSNNNGDSTVTTVNTATNGTGLNLLLINNIQTECFVKEYLTLCAENQNGTLDTANHAQYASVLLDIGINISESGYYSAGSGNILPKTDLPQGNDGAPKWDGAQYSLKTWDKDSHANGGATAFGGPFQFQSGGIITRIGSKSKYNTKGTSTSGDGGDCYLFPDCLCGLNGYVDVAASWGTGGSSDYSEEALNAGTVMAHNRGGGARYMAYGIPYDTIQNKKSAGNYVDDGKMTKADLNKYLAEIYNDAISMPSSVAAAMKQNAANSSGYAQQLFSYVANGWYFSPKAAANVKNRCSAQAMAYWNALFPNEQVSDQSAFNAAVDRHTKTMAVALGISAEECDSIYGTQNGDIVDYRGQSGQGDIFKVTNNTSSAYRKGTEKVVHCLDAICAHHVFKTFCEASVVYARMLQYAGVGIDPTDPSTYMGGYSSGGEWVPVEVNDNTAVSTLIAHGMDASQVTEKRLSVLIAASKLTGIPYKQCRHFSGCDGNCYDSSNPTHLDCSSFVWRAFKDAGCDMSGFPLNTASYAGSSAFKSITIDELKPGDVVVRRSGGSGHVELFLGKKSNSYSFVEEFKPGTVSGYTTKDVSTIVGANYKYYTYVGY